VYEYDMFDNEQETDQSPIPRAGRTGSLPAIAQGAKAGPAGRNGSNASIQQKRSIRKKAHRVPVGEANQVRRRGAIQGYSKLFKAIISVPPPKFGTT